MKPTKLSLVTAVAEVKAALLAEKAAVAAARDAKHHLKAVRQAAKQAKHVAKEAKQAAQAARKRAGKLQAALKKLAAKASVRHVRKPAKRGSHLKAELAKGGTAEPGSARPAPER